MKQQYYSKTITRVCRQGILLIFLALFLSYQVFAHTADHSKMEALNGEDILRQIDDHQIRDGVKAEGTIIIEDNFGTRSTEMISYSKNRNYTLIEFTSAAERGQKTLRVNDKIYLYYPDAEQVVTLNKSMFQQSLMDSDISYEDMAGDKSLTELYTAELETVEMQGGFLAYRLYLTAKNIRKTTYPYQKIWVRTDSLTVHKAEYYTRKKKLHKVMKVNKLEVIDSQYFATDITIIDVLKKGEGTTLQFNNISFETLDDKIFSVDNLRF